MYARMNIKFMLAVMLVMVTSSMSHATHAIHMAVDNAIDSSLRSSRACRVPKMYLLAYRMGHFPDTETLKKNMNHSRNHPPYLRYVPERSYKVYCDLSKLLSLKEDGKLGSVKSIHAILPEHKIGYSPRSVAADSQDGIFNLIVHIVPGTKDDVMKSLKSIPSLTSILTIDSSNTVPGKVSISINCDISTGITGTARCLEAGSRQIASIHSTVWIEKVQLVEVQNDIATSTVQSDVVGRHRVWEHGLTGTGQVIHVSDTGLHYESCFFEDPGQRIAFFPDFNSNHRKVVSYRQFINADGSRDNTDGNSHGTHVTGSICGSTVDPSNPMKKYSGLAPDAKVVFDDISGTRSSLLTLPNDLYVFLEPMHSKGIKLSHASWGGSVATAYAIMEREVDEFAWDHPDHLFIVAAGNSGRIGVLQPSSAKNTLSIGNRRNSEDRQINQNVALNSAAQSTFDGRTKPEICTPGDPIYSASLTQCDVMKKQGTSMAASFGTGAAALITQYLQEGYYGSGMRHRGVRVEPSASLLKALIIHSSRYMTGIHEALKVSAANPPPPNAIQGFGAMYLQDLLFFYDAGADRILQKNFLKFVNNATISQDGVHVFTFEASPSDSLATGRDVRATLVWTDPPAAEGATKALVNDLDLVVELPNGTLVYPRHNSGTGTFDRKNVVEQVRIPSSEVESGTYRVFVYGFHVPVTAPYNGQIFSLVVTAAGLVQKDNDNVDLGCPNDCSGRGVCNPVTKTCECSPEFHHVDCSLCSEEVWCHGNGECSNSDGKCSCKENFEGDRCERCAAGWFGVNCDSDCQCGNHGHCETEIGCICDPHFTGLHCEQCAEGWTSSQPTVKDCAVPSLWCSSNEIIDIDTSVQQFGVLQINDLGFFPNSTRCLWRISGSQPLTLNIKHYKMENRYDHMWVYEGNEEDYGKHVLKVDGEGGGQVLSFPNGDGFVVFESDFEGDPLGGIEIEFSVPCTTCNPTSSSGCGSNNQCVCTDGSFPEFRCDGMQTPTPPPVVPQYCMSPGQMVACSGRGVCNPQIMACDCHEGFIGNTCQTACPGSNPTPCNDHGTCRCVDDQCSSAVCVCDEGFGEKSECLPPPDPTQIMVSYTTFSLPKLKWYIGIIPSSLIRKNVIIRMLGERVEKQGTILPEVTVSFWQLPAEAGVPSLAKKTFVVDKEAICISANANHQYLGIRVSESINDNTQFIVELEDPHHTIEGNYSSCSSEWEAVTAPLISNNTLQNIGTIAPVEVSEPVVVLPVVVGFLVGVFVTVLLYFAVREYKARAAKPL
eukprot:TRINITY_DN2208_c0_g2_i1.p1 TRINITY_DN2208_c0_g2~~TRINITY_DN2208_c0_g2_i1.p1  ORF type:complete len:1303 (+),score=236.34 TRINITY_DN2208_c0_g2_i1:75-3911(+)